jgi:hypothetical protein
VILKEQKIAVRSVSLWFIVRYHRCFSDQDLVNEIAGASSSGGVQIAEQPCFGDKVLCGKVVCRKSVESLTCEPESEQTIPVGVPF